MTLERTKATANPSKAFFVRMLTRDISLEDCILDLIDNCVDGAWEVTGEEPNQLVADDRLKNFHIQIAFDETEFSIVDNCGGITLDQAADYAFTFGRRSDQTPDDFSVGVYGIGMKRAVFKIGNAIVIRSTFDDAEQNRQAFKVPIDVAAWMGRDSLPGPDGILPPPNWDFDIEEDTPMSEAGVSIRVRELTSDTSARFVDPAYERSLRRILGRDYMVPLMRGLQISVNGVPVIGRSIEFRENAELVAMRDQYTDGSVTVELLAGMISEPPDSTDPDEGDKGDDSSGWYVLCNGRVVLAADKSHLTGWGDDLPKWHRQYSGFAGVALFSAARAIDLPMTTTKRSVDPSSAVYRRALVRMREPARQWIDYTNARKSDLDVSKKLEIPVRTSSIVSVASNPTVKLPTTSTPTTREKIGNINFAAPKRKIVELARGFGDPKMTYREVGQRAFDFAHDELAEEE